MQSFSLICHHLPQVSNLFYVFLDFCGEVPTIKQQKTKSTSYQNQLRNYLCTYIYETKFKAFIESGGIYAENEES